MVGIRRYKLQNIRDRHGEMACVPSFQNLFRRSARDRESHQTMRYRWRVPRIMWCQPVKNPATVRIHLGKRLIVGPQNKRLGYSLFQLLPEYLIPS